MQDFLSKHGMGGRRRIVVRLFRLWSMAREEGIVTLGRMHAAASELSLPDQTAPACASLFELVEGALGRPLVRESWCARVLSADETALLGVLEAAPSLGSAQGSRQVPHGLPGAIRWAAIMVRQALDWPEPEDAHRFGAPAAACPFRDQRGGASLAL